LRAKGAVTYISVISDVTLWRSRGNTYRQSSSDGRQLRGRKNRSAAISRRLCDHDSRHGLALKWDGRFNVCFANRKGEAV